MEMEEDKYGRSASFTRKLSRPQLMRAMSNFDNKTVRRRYVCLCLLVIGALMATIVIFGIVSAASHSTPDTNSTSESVHILEQMSTTVHDHIVEHTTESTSHHSDETANGKSDEGSATSQETSVMKESTSETFSEEITPASAETASDHPQGTSEMKTEITNSNTQVPETSTSV